MADYKVALDAYSGPLDLLLFLIRRHEVDVYDIPIAQITRSYLEHVSLVQELNPEAVGEFLVLAASLMEIKSRMLLPTPPLEDEEDDPFDPRQDLVRRLLEYKDFKDRATLLEDAAAHRAQRHERSPVAIEKPIDPIELDNVDIWDLMEAFRRLLEQTGKSAAFYKVEVDDTPIALHADDILDALQRAKQAVQFESLFEGRRRSEMIGLFLALLELIRQRRVCVCQDRPLGPIVVNVRIDDESPAELERDADCEAIDGDIRSASMPAALVGSDGSASPYPILHPSNDSENELKNDSWEDHQKPTETQREWR